MPTVLVIDDDTATLDFVERVLHGAGYRVEMATSARAAMRVLAAAAIDAVLLEVILPEMEGVETILEVHRRWPDRPVVAMSGGGAVVSGDYALKLAKAVGAHAVLPKPFSGSDLLAVLDKALAGAEA